MKGLSGLVGSVPPYGGNELHGKFPHRKNSLMIRIEHLLTAENLPNQLRHEKSSKKTYYPNQNC